ncbi:hypothetical protein FPQ18DRAFT_93721 [Pyronema domesticum]|uniref:Similar to Uncharacterized transcriptional regulatory protein TBS1 acc. no. P38114 n=1 Tax=Pyronema omphalodes (strain CBS 100304) TaxID=1076935 RepID=U4LBV5_PYROM|nr:hypothetical protein FPQ18DRAFT_93721 [Pyronema domesticum]CCX07792.1 Similar to Uncharacterized transcriptional regulatory protein TBS1; acc. no. P38114 [Pyronema omphalodes CBS 100304]
MAALSHQHSPNMFSQASHNGMGGAPPPGYQHPAYHQQPAPRQRTAIACRYCRRRKIRCSGFETSQDGRCANCCRFNQECVFTPVSSQPGQIQAFVPAGPHLAGISQGGRPIQLYGAQGQPLPGEYANYGTPMMNAPSQDLYNRDQYGSRDDRGPPPPPLYPQRRNSDEYPHPNQPPSPSSHLPAPGHAFPMNGSFGQQSPPLAHHPSAGSYLPALQGMNSQRPDSPGSRRSSGELDGSSPSPPLSSSLMRPRDGPGSPNCQIPSMQIQELIQQPPQHLPLHSQRNALRRAAADTDMLSRINYRNGL